MNLSTGEIAKLFDVSSQTVINWMEAGSIQFSRIGRGPRMASAESVMNFIKTSGMVHDVLDNEMYSRLVSSTSVAVKSGAFYFLMDTELNIVEWSDSLSPITGLKFSDVSGKNPSDILGLRRISDHADMARIFESHHGKDIRIDPIIESVELIPKSPKKFTTKLGSQMVVSVFHFYNQGVYNKAYIVTLSM
jgi:PAS domain-containing protein